jgi:hypothetical protein
MKQYVIAILLSAALGLSASCSRTSDLPASQTQEDLTLKPAEYMDLGFPATDRPWTTADYQAAYHAMRTLPVAQFPRSTSPKSSPVVDRLANPDNLGLFLNKSLPLDQRFLPCIDLVDSANAISKLYLAAHAKTPLFAADFIRMEGFMLHAVTVELSLIEEFLPTLDKKGSQVPNADGWACDDEERHGAGDSGNPHRAGRPQDLHDPIAGGTRFDYIEHVSCDHTASPTAIKKGIRRDTSPHSE